MGHDRLEDAWRKLWGFSRVIRTTLIHYIPFLWCRLRLLSPFLNPCAMLTPPCCLASTYTPPLARLYHRFPSFTSLFARNTVPHLARPYHRASLTPSLLPLSSLLRQIVAPAMSSAIQRRRLLCPLANHSSCREIATKRERCSRRAFSRVIIIHCGSQFEAPRESDCPLKGSVGRSLVERLPSYSDCLQNTRLWIRQCVVRIVRKSIYNQ